MAVKFDKDNEMILDLPPHVEQAIISKAELQGITPAELLAKDYAEVDIFTEMEKHGLNSDGVNIVLTAQDAKMIEEHLNAPLTPYMQEILAKVNRHV